jgi:hypothetical protein
MIVKISHSIIINAPRLMVWVLFYTLSNFIIINVLNEYNQEVIIYGEQSIDGNDY